MSDPARWVQPLASFGRHDLALAGGKGATLGDLIRGGYSVPDGFVITTEAYAHVARGSDIGADPTRLASVADADVGAALRAALRAAPVPATLRAAIVAARARLGGAVAVRSSATAEDLPGAAFAGQQETFLNVVGEEALVDAVRRCWASLWTDRAIAYRQRRGIAPDEVRLAVVVQTMVQAETAGVLFTADPVSGRRDRTTVDAGAGLGEAVVAGLVTPDHYELNEHGEVVAWTAGRHETVIRGAATGGVVHEAGTVDGGRLLSDDRLTELARLGASLADRFGRPQDAEWAIAEGRLWLLQARPMTALPPAPLRLNRAQRLLGAMLLEYLPTRPYPLDMSTWVPHGPAGLMAKVAGSLGVRRIFVDFLVEEDGVVDRLAPPSPRPTLALLTAPFRLARRARRHEPSRWTEDPRVADVVRRVEAMGAQDLTAMGWDRLIDVPRRALALVAPIADLRIDYLPRAALGLLRLRLALQVLGRGDAFALLILGAPTRTEAANRALEALADRVRSDPELRRAFAERDSAELTALARRHVDFGARFRAFLDEFGHRETASPILMTSPTWGEAPGMVLDLIAMLVAEPRARSPRDRSEEALARVLEHPWLSGTRRRERFRRWVAAARAGVAFREDTHFFFTKPLPILRRALLEAGRRLCDAGVLHAAEDVVHLRLEELEAIGEPRRLAAADARRLRATVRERTVAREERAGVPLIDPRSLYPREDVGGDVLVSGIAAGGGRATGPVRVIRDPAEFGRLASGDVLVCPYTNPSWTPLFGRAAAVVVDAGGVASHAAIVAREYGLPAVMGTAVGTSVLADGQWVTVDGDRGRILAAVPPDPAP